LLGLLPFLINGVIGQIQDTEQQFRWGEDAALSLVLVYGGYLAASGRKGSRTLGIIIAIAYLYMGAVSITIPDHPGSWGLWGGVASIFYGVFYAAILSQKGMTRSVSSTSQNQ